MSDEGHHAGGGVGRWLVGGVVGLLIALAGVALTFKRENRRIQLSNGEELEILHVSLGTNHIFSAEPLWKQTLRRVLPAAVEARLANARGETISTHYSTLVVWLRVSASPATARPLIRRPAAITHGTNTFPGLASQINSNTFRLQFTAFARDREDVPLQLLYGGAETVQFMVNNPDPASSTHAPVARPLPQTNDFGHTRILLRRIQTFGRNEHLPLFAAKANPPPGWIQWSFTVFGDDGNWMDSRTFGRLESSLSPSGRFRIHATGTEYISAAFVEMPANGILEPVARPERAALFGLRDVYRFGAGVHMVSNGVAKTPRADPAPARVSFRSDFSENWSATIEAPFAGLFYWSDLQPGSAWPKLRIRERLADGRGRIFAPTSKNTVSVTNMAGKRMRVASLYTPALPITTTNLEVEVIVALPSSEFVFALPSGNK